MAGFNEGPLTVAREEDLTGLGAAFFCLVGLVDRADDWDDRVAGLRVAMKHLGMRGMREARDNVGQGALFRRVRLQETSARNFCEFAAMV